MKIKVYQWYDEDENVKIDSVNTVSSVPEDVEEDDLLFIEEQGFNFCDDYTYIDFDIYKRNKPVQVPSYSIEQILTTPELQKFIRRDKINSILN